MDNSFLKFNITNIFLWLNFAKMRVVSALLFITVLAVSGFISAPLQAQDNPVLDQESVFLKNFYDVKPDPNVVNPYSNELETMFSESEGYQIVAESSNATIADVNDDITTDLRQSGAADKPQTGWGWLFMIFWGLILLLLLLAILWGLYKAWLRFGHSGVKTFSHSAKQTEDFDPVTELQLANFALAAGESDKAKTMFANIIEHNPSFLEAHKGLLKIQGEAADRENFDKSYVFASDQYPVDSSGYKQLQSIRDYYFGNAGFDTEVTQVDDEKRDSKDISNEPELLIDNAEKLEETARSVTDEILVSSSADDVLSDQKESDVDVTEAPIIPEVTITESIAPEITKPTELDSNPNANFDPFVDSIAGKFSYQYGAADIYEQADVASNAENSEKAETPAVANEGVVEIMADKVASYNLTDVQDIGYVNETRLELAEYMLNSGNVIVANVLLKKVFQTGDGEKCIEAQKLIKKYTVDINLS